MTTPPGWAAPGSGGYPGGSPGPPPPQGGMPGGYAPPPGAGIGPPPGPKPGIIPLRPIGVGEVLDGAVTYIRRNPKATLGLSAIIVGITQLVLLAAQLVLFVNVGQLASLDQQALQNPTRVLQVFLPSMAGYGVTLLVQLFAYALLTGMLTAVVGRAVLGEHVTMAEAWRQASPRLPALLGVAIVPPLMIITAGIVSLLPGTILLILQAPVAGGLLIAAGIIACVISAVWIWVSFSLAPVAVVLERAGVFAALSRSRDLVRGGWWRSFGILLLGWIIAATIGFVLAIPFVLVQQVFFGVSGVTAGGAGIQTAIGMIVATVGAIIAGTVTRPFGSGVPALLYVDWRMRREGLDIQLQQAAGWPAPAPASGGPPGYGAPHGYGPEPGHGAQHGHGPQQPGPPRYGPAHGHGQWPPQGAPAPPGQRPGTPPQNPPPQPPKW